MGWLMQVLSVRGRRYSLRVHRAPFKREAETTDVTDTAFKRRSMYFSALPPARAPIEGSARDPRPPTAIAPTGTKPRRSMAAGRPCGASADGRKRKAPRRLDSAAAVVGSDRVLALNV